MSCCTVKQTTSSSSKHYNLIKKHFDNVELIHKEKYQQLILKDKAPAASNVDWVVWLDIKIAYQTQNPNYSKKDIELLDSVCEKIYDLLDLLRMPDTKINKQLSLFDDECDIEEKMPEQPKNDGGWDKYFRECKRVAKSRLKKRYTFLELFDITFYQYTGIDHRKELPSIEEFKTIYKSVILEGKENPGRHDSFWIDNLNYLIKEPLSDIELIHRLKSIVRIYLAPYTKYFMANYDLSYTDHSSKSKEPKIAYRFYTNGDKISHHWGLDYDKQELPSYAEIFDIELLSWVRETLNIPNKEFVSDEDVLKQNIEWFLDGMLWYGKKEYNWKSKIKTFRSYKEFYSHLKAFLKSKNIDSNGGGSGYSVDGFSGWLDRDRDGKVEVTQKINDRITMNRSVENLELKYNDEVIVYRLTGKEIYQKAYELFAKNENVKEMTIFDFLAA